MRRTASSLRAVDDQLVPTGQKKLSQAERQSAVISPANTSTVRGRPNTAATQHDQCDCRGAWRHGKEIDGMRALAVLFIALLIWPSSAIGLNGSDCKICNQNNEARTSQVRSKVGALGVPSHTVGLTCV
jgi:hypothetical protein